MEERKDYGAFIHRFELRPTAGPLAQTRLPLQGLTFAVKDIFDIDGYVTGFGNPDWARTHAAATSTSPVILSLLEAGATCIGKTIMDEMAFSVNGENYHYGTPMNPCAPDRAPGGSSSGSAVAVAAELVDFSLGTDTGGSVRMPAAFCGILGFRPSHGAVSTENVIPMAQSFDTVGWFAREPAVLVEVGNVLLQPPIEATTEPSCIFIPEDCFTTSYSPNDHISQILTKTVEKLFGGHLINQKNLGDYIVREVPSLDNLMLKSSANEASKIVPALKALSSASQLIQRFEIRANHAEWINNTKPLFGPGIAERVLGLLSTTFENLDYCYKIRSELEAALTTLLGDYGVLALPTVSRPPPKLGLEASKLDDFRANAFSMLSIAGLSRFCQITIPLGFHDNLPVSVSLLARNGADHFLLKLAQTLYGPLRRG
ncbi:hypothetical protein J5N97_015092 [Dioscorea zingiberensis]|uniref:Amidase domain-containing protein n=1 Tax=Dioscorea zingiberensis TaxID=325984 RepID=A0A9D5CUP8_9LILI|nr:hypothetical protein J5N97_015092 [Dioscorea zingiberensis]